VKNQTKKIVQRTEVQDEEFKQIATEILYITDIERITKKLITLILKDKLIVHRRRPGVNSHIPWKYFFRFILSLYIYYKSSLRNIIIIIITTISIVTDILHASHFMLLWYYL